MRKLLSTIAIAAGLLIPAMGYALPPASVTGIAAEYSDGQVHVHWDAVQDANVSFYRVYYGRRSILESGGQYDDFETVDGKNTSYIIKNPPDGTTLFISVLAVNTQLEESDYFTQEAQVNLDQGDAVGTVDTSTPSTESPFRREREANTIGLESADQISSTEVALQFSHDVILLPEEAKGVFRIENASGSALTLRRLVIKGSEVRVTTDPQKRGETYHVSVSSVLMGESPAGGALSLDDVRSTKTFTAALGLDSGSADTSSSVQPGAQTSSASAGTVTTGGRLTLSQEREGAGLWRITARWETTRATEEITGFVVRAEREGKEISVPSGERTVVFSGVKPGLFTVSVRAMTTNGASDVLRATIDTGKPVGGMAATGAGMTAVFVTSGAFAGWKRMRRKEGGRNEKPGKI